MRCFNAIALHLFFGVRFRRVQINHDGLKLNGIHQILVYADHTNKMGRSVNAKEKNT
jgi:hypothetical protein